MVKGQARPIERMQEMFDAEDLPLFPWLAWDKPNFVRIEPTVVTGRRYHIVDDASPDSSLGWSQTDVDAHAEFAGGRADSRRTVPSGRTQAARRLNRRRWRR